MNHAKKIALVTGANRGIGLEISKQLAEKGLHVIVTSRDESKGKDACQRLKKSGLPVTYHALDVTQNASVERIRDFVEKEFGRLDVLVNNAGILPDLAGSVRSASSSVFDGKIETIRNAMDTNLFGPLLLCQAFVPLMKKNKYGRIVHVSTGMAQLSEMNGGYPAYRLSKTALNALTRILADELKNTNILVNSVCPGWVKTAMGGENATRFVEQGADGIVWLATLPDDGPSGGFFRDRKTIPW